MVGLLLAGLFGLQLIPSEEVGEIGPGLSEAIALGVPAGEEDRIDAVKLAQSDQIAFLEHCLDHARGRYLDYTCTFVKQEEIRGKMSKRQVISVKFMERPFSVAMAWLENPGPGDQMLYVQGKYDNQMLARPTSSFLRKLVGGYVKRKPDGEDALKNTLRPVTMFGFKRGMENLLKVYKQAKEAGDLKEEFGGRFDLEGRETIKLVRYLELNPQADYPCWKTDIYIDAKWLIPIRIDGFDWERKQTSYYYYKDVNFGAGLTPDDFEPRACDIDAP